MTEKQKNLLKALNERKPLTIIFNNSEKYSKINWDGQVYREEEFLIQWDLDFLIEIAQDKVPKLSLKEE